MRWTREGAHDHEGWVANVLADGRVSASVTGAGVIVHELTADDVVAEREVRRYDGSDDVDVVIPWDQVATWRVMCQCGWTGEQLPAYDNPTDRTRDCPEALEDSVFAPAWDAHVAPHVALHDVEQLSEQLRELEQRIADRVQLAKAGGASWTQVGRAAGLSKQGAQQRWGPSPDRS